MEDISGWRAVRQWHSSASGWTDKTVVWKSSGGGEAIEAAFVLKEDSVLLFSISSSAPARDPLHPWYFLSVSLYPPVSFLFFPRK